MMGGAGLDEPERAGSREGAEDPEDAARVRGPAWPAATDRPAPRDQPDADPETPPDPAAPAAALPDLGGRSRGGATRPLLAASGMFLWRAVPAALVEAAAADDPPEWDSLGRMSQ